MAMTIPTRDGQGLGEFLDELRTAARAALLAGLDPSVLPSAWVKVEEDSITGSAFVAELCGVESGDAYYRFTYRRDDGGALVLDAPVRVTEVTTYEPADLPPVAMGLVLESLPVHAPPAAGLVRGRPVQLLRVGPLHDPVTGDALLDVTDEMCASTAASAAALGYGVPIDMGHALYHGGDGGAVLYGRIVELEARPGSGLWGTPEWTDAGRALLSQSPGLYYLSPTLLGSPRDPQTGAPMPGRILHSVSLTAKPRQDSLDSLALSQGASAGAASPKGEAMAANQGTGTPKPDDTVTLSITEHNALLLAQKKVAEAEAKASAAEAENVTLSQRVGALEAAALARQVDDEVATAERQGRVVGASLRRVLLTMAAPDRATLLGELPVTRPVSPIGHGERTEPMSHEDRALSILRKAREGKMSIDQAAKEVL